MTVHESLPGDVGADSAPAELNAPAAGTPAAAPNLPPAEQHGTPPEGFTASDEPDLSEAGLAREAEKLAAEKAAKAPKPAKAKAEETKPAEETAPAPEAEAAPADPEKPADEPPKPEEPSPGKLATQLRARERKLVQQQQTFARERSEFETYKKNSEAQLTAMRSDADRGRQMVDAANKVVALAQQDPFQLLANLGYTKEILQERWLNDGKAGPNELAARTAEEHVRRAIAERDAVWERRFAEEKAAREAEQTQRARVESEAHAERELTKFVSTSRGDAERWPLASKYSDAKLRARGMAIADENVRAGHRLTNEEILDRIEEELNEVVSLAPKAKPGTPSAAVQPAPSAKSKTSPQVQTGANRSQPAPTLTSAAAGERSAVIDEFDPLTATEEEILAATMREIEAEKQRRANGAARR